MSPLTKGTKYRCIHRFLSTPTCTGLEILSHLCSVAGMTANLGTIGCPTQGLWNSLTFLAGNVAGLYSTWTDQSAENIAGEVVALGGILLGGLVGPELLAAYEAYCGIAGVFGIVTSVCSLSIPPLQDAWHCPLTKRRGFSGFSDEAHQMLSRPYDLVPRTSSSNPCSEFLRSFPIHFCEARSALEELKASCSAFAAHPDDIAAIATYVDIAELTSACGNILHIDLEAFKEICQYRAAVATFEPYCTATSMPGPSQRARRNKLELDSSTDHAEQW